MFISKLGISCLLLISGYFSMAQTVKVKKEQTRVKNNYADGFEVDLPGTYEDVNDALERYIKTFGKTKESEGIFSVAEPSVVGRTYTSPLYASTKQVGNIISAWVGLKKNEWKESEEENVSKALEQLVYEFGVAYHREKIQKQIDESLRASQAVERQMQRLTNQNKSLNTKIANNKQEKIDLEKALVTNKIELETLTRQLEKNKKDQDSVAIAGQQIQKVIEMQREKFKSVH